MNRFCKVVISTCNLTELKSEVKSLSDASVICKYLDYAIKL